MADHGFTGFKFFNRLIPPICSTAASFIALYAYMYYNPLITSNSTYDYFIWFSTLLSLYALYIDVKRYYNKPFLSTMLFELVGGLLIVSGRVLSLCYNSFSYFGYIGALVGELYNYRGFYASLLIMPGSFYVAAASTVNALFNSPVIVLQGSPSIKDVYSAMLSHIGRLSSWLCIHDVKGLTILGCLAFLSAFTFRFLPELYWWPFLIGWDTPEYAAHLADFAEKWNPFTSYYWMGSMRNTPPLLNILLAPFTQLLRPYLVYKYYPSFAYGVLSALASIIVVMVYRKSWGVGLLAGLSTAVFILNLRISWDYQRQLLGSIIMLTAVLYLETRGVIDGWRSASITLLLLILCGLSHEVTGLAGFTLSLALFLQGVKKGNKYAWTPGLIGLITNFSLEAWYWGKPYSYAPSIGYLPIGLTESYDARQVVDYLIAGYGLVLPLMLPVLVKYKRLYLNASVIALLLAGISPLIAPYSSVVTWYRFLIGIAPLASALSVVGLVDVTRDWRIVAAYYVVFSIPGLAFTYGYNLTMDTRILREFPWRLDPSPANLKYLDTYEFFENNRHLYDEAVIIAHSDIARYVHLAIRNPEQTKLIWVNTVSNETICRVIKDLGVKKAVIVLPPWSNVTSVEKALCVNSVKTLDDEFPWILLIEAKCSA